MLHTLILVVHVLVAIALIVLVLLQQGKGADAGAAFGSGASATVFGSQGSASFMTRATAALATVFFVTSLSLAYYGNREARAPTSVVDTVPAVVQQPAKPLTSKPVTIAPAKEHKSAPESDVPLVH